MPTTVGTNAASNIKTADIQSSLHDAGRYVTQDPRDAIHRIEHFVEQLGPEFGSQDIIEQFEKSARKVKLKHFEFLLLSYIAFHADDDVLTDQRRQLFLTTKMLYNNEINAILKDAAENDTFSYHGVEASCEGPREDTFSKLIRNVHRTTDRIRSMYYDMARISKVGYIALRAKKD